MNHIEAISECGFALVFIICSMPIREKTYNATPHANLQEPHPNATFQYHGAPPGCRLLSRAFDRIQLNPGNTLHGLSWSLSVRRSHQLCDIVIAWDYMLYLRNVYQRLNVVQSPSVVVVHFHFLLGHFFKLRLLCLVWICAVHYTDVPSTWIDNFS